MSSSPNFFDAIFQCEQFPFKAFSFQTRNVTESLYSEVGKWVGYPVLINAPTGAGKSTFVFNTLADFARSKNRYILVLSNRLALNMQQKVQLSKKFGIPDMGTRMLEDYHIFGNIVLSTYQNILPIMHGQTIIPDEANGPMFIVFDEAHFFCSDATFNPWTETILRTLMQRYPSSTRIYMSATPEDVKPAIAAIEYENFKQPIYNDPAYLRLLNSFNGAAITEYIFPRDYQHISLRFFSHWDTILGSILNASDSNKWLIFVNQKETGRDLKKQLSSTLADFIHAASSSDTVRTLTRRQCFDQKVLISTSVIDNGISIHDSLLKNIVLDFVDYIELVQMLGRKRTYYGENINLYVKIPSIDEVKEYRKCAESLYETMLSFEMNPSHFFQNRWGSLIDNEQKLFAPMPYQNSVTFGINTFAKYQLALQCGKYEKLEDELSKDANAYARQVCSWLQKPFSADLYLDHSLDQQAKSKMTEILNSYLDTSISADIGLVNLEESLKSCLNPMQIKNCKLKNDGSSRGAANIKKIIKAFDLPYSLSGKHKNSYQLTKTPEITPKGHQIMYFSV